MNDDMSAPPATPKFMTVENFDVLGNLVKSWSTGDPSYTGGTLHPEPKTIEELREVFRVAGVGADIPAGITKLTVVRYGPDELVLRIPPASLIKAKEARLQQPGVTYDVPDFYTEVPIKGSVEKSTRDEKMLLQARRIGDYTIAHCE